MKIKKELLHLFLEKNTLTAVDLARSMGVSRAGFVFRGTARAFGERCAAAPETRRPRGARRQAVTCKVLPGHPVNL